MLISAHPIADLNPVSPDSEEIRWTKIGTDAAKSRWAAMVTEYPF